MIKNTIYPMTFFPQGHKRTAVALAISPQSRLIIIIIIIRGENSAKGFLQTPEQFHFHLTGQKWITQTLTSGKQLRRWELR